MIRLTLNYSFSDIGDKCVNNEDCGGVDTMICSKGICQCVEKTHPSSDKHVCRSDSMTVGSKCEENLDCMFENSYCDTKSHSCQCAKGYIYNNGSCVSGITFNVLYFFLPCNP